ncbi:NmrA family NAD(P)-binding protein [Tenggerimyces flavus]|uniref:NmrA family NAD(P)-binding protein n=1 Tax=Tenggerimyces flavus TaxID=1708749 RepID=A0ABV7YCY6_9ACTN|nr:NmrA family NAD(P)-binding protein [Tenggerimyces flavus]MBM7787166.1 uncharacterized protein YbjT (DUF2867 family) [Tenggerimyces flavus]
MILVTGATGNVGSNVVRLLRERGHEVREFTRELTDREAVRKAFDGVDRVFVSTPNHPHQVTWERNLIDAAAAARVERVVKLSANGAAIGSPVAFWDAQGRLEADLLVTGLPAVVLRPTTYLTNLLASAEAVRQTGKLFLPAEDAKVTLIDPYDVAEVAVVALTEDGHTGRNYLLTGPSAVTFHEVAAELSAVLGREIEYVPVPEEGARMGMLESGMPPWFADELLNVFRELRRGVASAPTDVVRVLTGREPRTVGDFFRAHADAF